MHRMMYKAYDNSPTYIETVKDIKEFFRLRSILAEGIGYHTKQSKDTLELYDDNKQIGKYYADK